MMSFQICRCCLRDNPACKYSIFVPIPESDDNNNISCRNIFNGNENLRAALLTCVPTLHVERDDGLPDVICDQCLLRLRDALEFRRHCEESERELQRRYADTERAIEEALQLINVLDDKEHPMTADLGPNELAMLDDLLQLEEHCVQRPLDGAANVAQVEKPAFKVLTSRGVKDLRLLTDSEAADLNLQKAPSIPPPQELVSPEHTDSSASSTDSSHDSTPKSLHPCPECEKKFTRKFQLKLHMISVHKLGDGLQYECDECHKTFASRHSLSYHQRSVHSDERPHACTHCDRRFVLRTQLSSHLRIHTGEAKPRIFQCHMCDKRWPTKSVLRTHMRSHVVTQERPFKCGQCDKAFFTRGHLNSHLLVHTGEKPFSCPTCGKSYQCVGNLNNHMARQHDFERILARGRSAKDAENLEI